MRHFVITKRTIDNNNTPLARTTDGFIWGFSGPFVNSRRAEAAATSALGARSCVAATVVSEEDVPRLLVHRENLERGFFYELRSLSWMFLQERATQKEPAEEDEDDDT